MPVNVPRDPSPNQLTLSDETVQRLWRVIHDVARTLNNESLTTAPMITLRDRLERVLREIKENTNA